MDGVLRNARVYRGSGFEQLDVLIRGGRIERLGRNLPAFGDVPERDLRGYCMVPGLVDVHVHLREPGFLCKESIRTGTLAAAHGGYTTVCPMPNLNPVPDAPEHLQVQLDAIARDAVVHVRPYGAITVGEKGAELAQMEAMAPLVAGFSDDGRGVQDESVMRAAMQETARLGKILAAHCEVNELLHGGYIHDGSYAHTHGHRGICSESEWGQIARDLRLARETGARYHVCHISTKESVALIRKAKAQGVDVTCETGPHYLVFTDADLQEDGRFKMNPPLRSAEDRAALIEGLLDGTIDMIATDHAPHEASAKNRGLEGSAMGVVGLETAFAVMNTFFVKKGLLTLERLVELMAEQPSRRFGLGSPLEEGQAADFAVFDLDREWIVDPSRFLSRGRATPFAGCRLAGQCVLTVVNGESVWEEDGAAALEQI
ncbi:dihydroorotase [uncultured Mailhella sp.]|uniref:dihydroorotase n=1 Tax=uncultured Mailhella sp. TaxID=1981031 RepID=UPI00262C7DF6|nr:dihydroorotase [uncultured Mailhella sp.]